MFRELNAAVLQLAARAIPHPTFVVMGRHHGSAACRRRNALRRQQARMAFRGRGPAATCSTHANGFARRVGPAERARGAGVAEGSLRTAGTPGSLADAKTQPARRESLRIVVLDHQPRRLGLHDLAAGPQELTPENRAMSGAWTRAFPPQSAAPACASRDCSNSSLSPADRRSRIRVRRLPSGRKPALPT